MVNNPALWFVIGVIAAVVVHTTWKFFTRYWEYQSDINALDLRITNLQGELEEYRRHFDFRLNSNFQHLNNKINTLSDRVTALEPKKTK